MTILLNWVPVLALVAVGMIWFFIRHSPRAHQRRIVNVLRAHPGVSKEELAWRAKVPLKDMSYALYWLSSCGVIRSDTYYAPRVSTNPEESIEYFSLTGRGMREF